MKKFRKTIVKPLLNMKSLNLNIAKIEKIDLTQLPYEVMEDKMNQVYDLIKKSGDAIVAFGIGNNREETYVSSVLNSSENKKQTILLQEPNPIQMYYKIANEHLEVSYNLRSKIRNTKRVDNYGDLLTNYFKEVSQGIVFLIMTLEGFFNFGINALPDDAYFTFADGRVITKPDAEWLDFNRKIRYIIPALTHINYFDLYKKQYDKIVKLNDLRNDLIHLKRVIKKNFTSYEDLNKRLIDFNPYDASEIVFHFINTNSTDFLVEDI